MSAALWHYESDGVTEGPMSAQELERRLKLRLVKPDDSAWNSRGMKRTVAEVIADAKVAREAVQPAVPDIRLPDPSGETASERPKLERTIVQAVGGISTAILGVFVLIEGRTCMKAIGGIGTRVAARAAPQSSGSSEDPLPFRDRPMTPEARKRLEFERQLEIMRANKPSEKDRRKWKAERELKEREESWRKELTDQTGVGRTSRSILPLLHLPLNDMREDRCAVETERAQAVVSLMTWVMPGDARVTIDRAVNAAIAANPPCDAALICWHTVSVLDNAFAGKHEQAESEIRANMREFVATGRDESGVVWDVLLATIALDAPKELNAVGLELWRLTAASEGVAQRIQDFDRLAAIVLLRLGDHRAAAAAFGPVSGSVPRSEFDKPHIILCYYFGLSAIGADGLSSPEFDPKALPVGTSSSIWREIIDSLRSFKGDEQRCIELVRSQFPEAANAANGRFDLSVSATAPR